MADRPAPYLQEFEALDSILLRVPHKAQQEIHFNDVEWTCIDVTKEYLVIGTNSSILCLYDRLTGQVKRLNVKLKGITITAVKLIKSIDYEIAVGTSNGQIFVYVLTSEKPEINKTLQVFTIADLHTAAITCLEWSQNAMKLFSGDMAGTVVCTEIDYCESASKSFELCRESYEIVQLSYVRRTLLISSTFRTVLFASGQVESIIQVGTKDRKMLGRFGAVVMPNREHSKQSVVFASRPGLRLWQAGLDGKVTATYIFKDLVTEHSKNVSLLTNTTMGLLPHSMENYQFGLLSVYQQSYILSYHGTELFVIDPVIGAFTSYHTNLGHITDVAVCDDEVFILRNVTGRVLLRLACKPEQRIEVPSHLSLKRDSNSPWHSSKSKSEVSPVQVLSSTASKMSHGIIGLVKEVTEKIQSVTEGHMTSKASTLPPWGAVGGQEASFESSVQSVTRSVGSPDGSVDSAHEASPSLNASPTKTSPALNGTSSETVSDQLAAVNTQPSSGQGHLPNKRDIVASLSDPPPIIRLDGDQLLVLKVEHHSPKQERRQDITAMDDSSGKQNSLHRENCRYENIKTDGTEEELVYFQKTKKSRKKKVKPDVTSIHSVDSTYQDSHWTSPLPTQSSTSSPLIGIYQEPAAGLSSNLPHEWDHSSESQPPAIGVQRETQIFNNRHIAYDIDLEKLKKDDNIDVFGMLHERPTTMCVGTERRTYAKENYENQYDCAIHQIQKDMSETVHVEKDSCKIDHVEKDSCKTDHVQKGSCKTDLVLKDNSVTDHVQKDSCMSDHVQKNSGKTDHVQKDSSKTDHVQKDSGKTGHVQKDSGKTDHVQKDSGKTDHVQKDSGKTDHVQKDSGKTDHVQKDSGKTDHVQKDSCMTDHVQKDSCNINTSHADVELVAGTLANMQHQARFESTKPVRLNLHLDAPVTRMNTAASQSHSDSSQDTSPEAADQSSSSLSKKSTSDVEDFYSLYNAQPFSPSSPETPQGADQSLPAAVDYSSHVDASESVAASCSSKNSPKQPLADSWVDFKAPSHACSMSLTNKHIWFVDRKQCIFYSTLSGPRLKWKTLSGPAKQIAVSPNGWIIWKLHNNMIYVGTVISASNHEVKDWREIASDVAYISVDDQVAWYIKLNGELGMHKSLSKYRPCNRCTIVKCPHQVSQIRCHRGVVWALTAERNIIVRIGVSVDREEGTEWTFLQGDGPCQLVSSFAFGHHETAWILDLVGRVWFTTGVTPDKPTGSGYWWQVSMGEYLMQDFKAFYTIKSLLEMPQNFSKLVKADKGGIIRAGRQGVWLCPGYRDTFHACRGNILGHRWEMCILRGLISSTKWLHASASASVGGEGLIWALQSSGSFFCFPTDFKSGRILEVGVPKDDVTIITVSASHDALWVLMANGEVYIRADISQHCRQGLQWARLSLVQIGNSQFIHLSCGGQTVWAVDDGGMVYMRIGVQAPGMRHLNPAWVVVDGCTKDVAAKFVKVFVGTNDSMVWALDNKNSIYVRRGVTEELPVGKYWYYVSGTKATTVCVSDHTVYALNLNGEVLVRYGISEENSDGDYWKKIPGAFSALSVTADDELWAVDKDNYLYKRHTYYLRHHNGKDVLCPPEGSTDEGWELL